MKNALIALTLMAGLFAPLQARPNLSQEQAAAMIKEGRTLRGSVAAPKPMVVWGSLKDWKRTHLEAERGTGFWKAVAPGGVTEAELPSALWGKTFKISLEGHLRQGTLQASVVNKEALQLREVVNYTADKEAGNVKAETVVTCPPGGARLRLETSPGSWLKLDSVKISVTQ